MNEWKWNGARWWKFDFHTHTQASDDYGKGPQQKALKARALEDWLLDYMRAGVDCVAVTDHNTGAGIDPLRAALEGIEGQGHPEYRGLTLFPGVELSVNGGVQVLAIFGPETAAATIDRLLGAVDYEGTAGKTDGETRKSFVEVAKLIAREGGLAVPAHVDRPRGLFGLQGKTLEQALRCSDVFAMELTDSKAEKPALYHELRPYWTEILGSDAHHPTGARSPGSHFTWVKMSAPTIEGLRLALLDGPLSVRRSDVPGGDPNLHASKVIESIEVRNTRYMGRSTPFQVTLSPWLNAVIGGRGTGKSTLVEFLRLALRRQDELPEVLTGDFEKYRKLYVNRSEDGLLTEGTEIFVTYRKDRSRFRVQWSQTGSLEPIEEEESADRWRPVAGEIPRHFPARIYSQKQIFELARAPLSLLRIVDEEVDRRAWDERWNQEESRFLALRAKARDIEAGFAEEPRIRGDLDDIRRKLEIFEEAGHSSVLRAYQSRQRQKRVVDTWEESWSGAGDRLRELAADLVPDDLDSSAFAEEEQDVLDVAGSALEKLKATRERLGESALEADRALAQWRLDRDASAWHRSVNGALAAYSELCDKLTEKDAGDPGAYGELVQRRQALEKQLADFKARRQQLERTRKDFAGSLDRLRSLRKELTQRRKRFLDEVLSENIYVRIEVVPYGDRGGFESSLRGILEREDAFRKDLGGLLEGLYSSHGDGPAFEQGLTELKVKVRDLAALDYDPGEVKDPRFPKRLSLLPPEAIDRVDTLFPEDTLDVQYSSTDGGKYLPIQEGSPGQRTAALLAFLLSYGEDPIILDQPEDDLDNHLIYDLIVTQLRQMKHRRQMIVVTHNANIVVNGDAELVVALAARGGESHKECEGSLQEEKVRSTICDIMEGGRVAFERRYRRIALKGRHV